LSFSKDNDCTKCNDHFTIPFHLLKIKIKIVFFVSAI
jgi:hypothetical protein